MRNPLRIIHRTIGKVTGRRRIKRRLRTYVGKPARRGARRTFRARRR